MDLVEEQAGKQQDSPGPEYLGCKVGANRGSDLCSCGAARLSFGAGIPEAKRAEDVCGKMQVPLKERRRRRVRRQQAACKALPIPGAKGRNVVFF